MSGEHRPFFKLDEGISIEVIGADALTIANNLTTNDIKALRENTSCESFVTNAKGWTVAHGFVLKMPDRIRLFGQHPSPSLICEHIDRYIIREDARISDLSAQQTLLLVAQPDIPADCSDGIQRLPTPIADYDLLVLPREQEPGVVELLGHGASVGELQLGSADEFEELRVLNFWPLKGREIGEKTIPKELDRDTQAISYTKGCYLGQETVARLDARGQLNKKMCRLQFPSGSAPKVGDKIKQGEKDAGEVTSVAKESCQALAVLRRGTFDEGAVLNTELGDVTVLAPIASGPSEA
ncbi:MAG: hypothetical protein AAF483_06305 [Planctomycetota bacterium]